MRITKIGKALILAAIVAGTLTLSGRLGTAEAVTVDISGFQLIYYTIAGSSEPNLACGAQMTQTGDNLTATIDCSSATGGTLTGTIDQAASPKQYSGTITFGPPFNYTVTLGGPVSDDGSTGSGNWSCTSGCVGVGGTYTFSRIAPSTPECVDLPAGPPEEVTLTSSFGDQLIIPAGSVNGGVGGTTICAQVISLPVGVGAGSNILSRAYRLTPEGTTFDPPATAIYHYSDDEIIAGMDETNLRVAVYDNVQNRWEVMTGIVDTEANTVTIFPVNHFSVFTVGLDCGTGPDTDSAFGDPDGIPDLCDLNDDDDGCSDSQELGLDETLGGLRNPLIPWDFYDTNGDQVIDLLNDILGVILHYSPTGAPPYDITFDRGPTAGPNAWNMTAPDGVIDLLNDILGVIQQYNHDCT